MKWSYCDWDNFCLLIVTKDVRVVVVFRLVRAQLLALIGHMIVFLTCDWLLVFRPNYVHRVITIPHLVSVHKIYADFTALWMTDANHEN